MKTYTIKAIIFFMAIWIYVPMLYAQQGDTLFIQRSKKGKIEFARFKKDANSDRKMKNDTTFLKSIPLLSGSSASAVLKAKLLLR